MGDEASDASEATGRLLLIAEKAEGLKRPTPGGRAMGRITLILISGTNLSCPQDKGEIEAYCEATLGCQEQKSPVLPGCSPHWNTSMQFLVRDINQEILCLTVYDRDYFAPNEFLGRTELKVDDIAKECKAKMGPITRSLKLQEADSGLITIKLDIQLFG